MQTKIINPAFEVKALGEDGTFEGLLSVYGNIDLGGDVVTVGAFTKSLGASNGKIPLLAHHDGARPIGVLECIDSSSALSVRGRLNMSIEDAKTAHAIMKFNIASGLKSGLSIGYRVVRDSIKDGIRYLEELHLLEGSFVTLPMNPLAVITAVKSASSVQSARDFETFLRDAGFSRREAEALTSGGFKSFASLKSLPSEEDELSALLIQFNEQLAAQRN